MDNSHTSPFVPGPGWRPFKYQGRSMMLDPGGIVSVELTADGWVLDTVPACVVEREGVAVARTELRRPGDGAERPGADWSGWKLGRYLYMVSADRQRALRRIDHGWDESASAEEVCRRGERIAPPFWVEWEYDGRTFLVKSQAEVVEIDPQGWTIPRTAPVTSKGWPKVGPDWVPWEFRGRQYTVARYLVHAVERTDTGWSFVGTAIPRPRIPLPTEPLSDWLIYRLGEREFRVSPQWMAAFERVGDGWRPAAARIVAFWCWPDWPRDPVDPPGEDWTPWCGDGREFMVSPDERCAAERTSDGWVYANAYGVKCLATRMTDFARFEPRPNWFVYDYDGRHIYVSPTRVALERDGTRWRFVGSVFWIEECGTLIRRPGPSRIP